MKISIKTFNRISKGDGKVRYSNPAPVWIAFFIVTFFKETKWYKLAFRIAYIASFPGCLFDKRKRSVRLLRASMVNKLLSFLARTGINFPISYRYTEFCNANHSSGVILCTAHLPLAKVAIRAMMENKIIIDTAIMGELTPSNSLPVFGITEKIPAILSNPYVLLRAKTILANNKNILLMIDDSLNDFYSPNIMHLCSKAGSKVLFFFAELMPNGIIETYLMEPPHPYCKNDMEINTNVKFMKQKVEEIKSNYRLS